jgi:hypothetical protein
MIRTMTAQSIFSLRRAVFALVFATGSLAAQTPTPQAPAAPSGPAREVLVVDRQGQPIPYAFVVVGNGSPRVADGNGVAPLASPIDADSAELVVRRIGYRPHGDWVKRNPAGQFTVVLDALPRALNPRTISERRDTPLARAGFYDRMERVRRGATVGRFITPEELDQRLVNSVGAILSGESYIRMQRYNQRLIMTGRSPGCAIAVILDGMRMTNIVEELYTREGQDEVRRLGGGEAGTSRFLATRQSVDDLISAMSVAGIEVYPTAAGAPIELQRMAGNGACGIVAIWSGGRQ